jgi:hypothetical protein
LVLVDFGEKKTKHENYKKFTFKKVKISSKMSGGGRVSFNENCIGGGDILSPPPPQLMLY